MKRLITLCIVLTAVALLAGPVLAEVQNVKVSGDVKSTGVLREDYTLRSENQLTTESPYTNGIITQARVRVDADLTDNVSATVRYLTQYYWDTQDHQGSNDATASTSADDVDLDLANVTLKEVFYGPLTVIVGRQPLRLGNGFVLGDPDTNTTDALSATDMAYGDLSLRKSFDAVKAILDYSPLTVDLLYSKINETNAVAGAENDIALYGANASYVFDNYNAEAEAYVLLLHDDTNTAAVPTAPGVRNSFRPCNEVTTYGARGSMTPMDNLNVLGELAFQRGEYDAVSGAKRDQEAYAYQLAGDYTLVDMSWMPVVRVGWTHYSGEQRNNGGDHEGWIPLFEDQSHGVVANYIFGGVNGGQNSNADILNLGATVEPIEDLALSVDFYDFWLDEKIVSADDTLANNGGTNDHPGLGWYNLTSSSLYMNPSDKLGYEIDLGLNYDYTEDVKMGLSAGWFVPGKALRGSGSSGANTNEETAIQVLATLDVSF